MEGILNFTDHYDVELFEKVLEIFVDPRNPQVKNQVNLLNIEPTSTTSYFGFSRESKCINCSIYYLVMDC